MPGNRSMRCDHAEAGETYRQAQATFFQSHRLSNQVSVRHASSQEGVEDVSLSSSKSERSYLVGVNKQYRIYFFLCHIQPSFSLKTMPM